MTDLVERLRSNIAPSHADCLEAADRIEELEGALRPFAAADRAIGDEPGPFRFETMRGYREISRDDLRRASEALTKGPRQ